MNRDVSRDEEIRLAKAALTDVAELAADVLERLARIEGNDWWNVFAKMVAEARKRH